jgi:hypothetical protein
MAVYTLEIAGRAIAAFNEDGIADAERFVENDELRNDLTVCEFDGAPLWDGKTELFVRDALPEEQAHWQTSHARAILDGNEEGSLLVFLVPVKHPTGGWDLTDHMA